MNESAPTIVYQRAGYCPICETDVEFSSRYDWYRDHLLCSKCRSIPRERALALVLSRRLPNWRELTIHESSPEWRGISPKLRRECPNYIATQYFPGEPLGKEINGFRNENLEVQTFADETFDLVVTLDVMEHVNEPEEVLREIARTLKPGGTYLFTTPTYKDHVESERRAHTLADGSTEHFGKPEYHGNPISDAGSLVTFHFGYDLAQLTHDWSDMDVEVIRFHDHGHGIIGEFTEVYIATKSARTTATPKVAAGRSESGGKSLLPREARVLCEAAARPLDVSPDVHKNDPIFRFVHDHRGFPSKDNAVNYYFQDGANSADKLRRLIDERTSGGTASLKLLEFAAGYGSITRHAKRAFVEHVFECADMNVDATEFLSRAFAVPAHHVGETPGQTPLPAYDVIFTLSFFTRTPRSLWGTWLQQLYAALRPGGVLIFTTHGTESLKHFPQAVLDDSGFWHEQPAGKTGLFDGQTITAEAFVNPQIAELPNATCLVSEHAAWWGHQDLYIVRKG